MAVRIGINPLTWTNDDMPELGGDTPLETCLKEAAEGRDDVPDPDQTQGVLQEHPAGRRPIRRRPDAAVLQDLPRPCPSPRGAPLQRPGSDRSPTRDSPLPSSE